jgi:hypothetical protein
VSPPVGVTTAAAAAYTCAAWPCACATTASRKRKSSGPQRPRIYKHRASSSCCPNGSWRARGDCSSLACPCVLLTGPAGMQQQAPHHHPGLHCCCHLTSEQPRSQRGGHYIVVMLAHMDCYQCMQSRKAPACQPTCQHATPLLQVMSSCSL